MTIQTVRRWAVVAAGLALLCGLPVIASALPVSVPPLTAGQLRARIGFGQAARDHPPGDHRDRDPAGQLMYFTDRGIEELADRRGSEEISLGWLSLKTREFVDVAPEFEAAVDRLATWLARLDDED